MKFSVLMSVYINDNGSFLDRAITSIWDDQELKPSEIILIEDGPISQELSNALKAWEKKLRPQFKRFKLEANQGNGAAKNFGMLHCENELIAIMDSDDISKPDRFKKQVKVFENKSIDVCGSWVDEFNKSETTIDAINKRPENHSEIFLYSKNRNPINHPSVMFKKKSVLDAGGYIELPGCEDQYLWVRMLMNKSIFFNIQESLVLMRISEDLIHNRRSGWRQNIKELNAQKVFFKIGFLNKFQYIRNIIIGTAYRLMPKFVVKFLYRVIRKYF